MTRAKVIQLGFLVLLVGAIGYGFCLFIGLDGFSAGIAAEGLLLFLILGWTGSYLFRVFNGKMTFNEQRKRYREAYEKITNKKLQDQFESLTEEEQAHLIHELENESNTP